MLLHVRASALDGAWVVRDVTIPTYEREGAVYAGRGGWVEARSAGVLQRGRRWRVYVDVKGYSLEEVVAAVEAGFVGQSQRERKQVRQAMAMAARREKDEAA